MPLLSIVIATYNYGRFLETALKSVLDQKPDFEGAGLKFEDLIELIVVDGGSTDNTVEIIKKYEDYISWWVSEKDRGQSDAFNKGFAHARGRYLTWLNADDVFFPGSLLKIWKHVQKHPQCEWIAGAGAWLDPDLNVVRCNPVRPLSRYRIEAGVVMVCGPSSIFARTLLDRVGGKIDERFEFEMDTELWNRFCQRGGAKFDILPGYCWGLRMHKDAKMSGHNFADSPTHDKNHPVWERRRKESALMKSLYERHALTLFRRMASTKIIPWMKGWIDTWRYQGKPYRRLVEVR